MDKNTSQGKKHEVRLHKKHHESQPSQWQVAIATVWKSLVALLLLLLLFVCTTMFSHATKSIATPVDVIATPIPTDTDTTTPSPGPSPTVGTTPTPNPTATPSPTVVATPSPTVVATPSPTVVATPSPTVVATPSPTVVATPSPTPRPKPTATPIPTIGVTPTAGVAPTIVPTQKAGTAPQPVATPQPTKTPQPTATPSPVPTLRSVATATVNTKRIITAKQETHSESLSVIPLVLGTLLILCLGGVSFIGFRRVHTALLPAISAKRLVTAQNTRPWQRIRTAPQPAAQSIHEQATSHIAPLPVSPSHSEPLMKESRTGAMRRLGRVHLQAVAPQETSDE